MIWPNIYAFICSTMHNEKLWSYVVLLYIIINWMARPCKILGQRTPPGQQTGFSET